MPNWNSNKVTLKHTDPAMIERAKLALAAGNFLQEFIPCPQPLIDTMSGFHGHDTPEQAALAAQEAANVAAYGYKNWYDWCVVEWGTKWDLGEVPEVLQNEDGSITFFAETAWAPPISAYRKLTELGFDVTAYYWEPGMSFCGSYTNDEDDVCIEIQGNSKWVESHVPEEINEAFGISEGMAEWEEEDAAEDQ